MGPLLATREKLQDERTSITRRFSFVGEDSFFVTVGLYENGKPGEIFVWDLRMGSSEHALLDAACEAISLGLQYGIQLEVFTSKLRGKIFEPRGFTGDPEFPVASSKLDLIAQWLIKRFVRLTEVN